MPTNLYVNNYDNAPEQTLIQDLIIESIKFYGMDVHWIPRIFVKKDQLYGEDTLSKFTVQYPIEVYVKNIEGFEGEGDLLSRFGLEIRDQVTFTMAIRRFNELDSGISRPREGDLIYFPLSRPKPEPSSAELAEGGSRAGQLFEIKFVEHESMFYPSGTLPVYDLRCETFVYSSEEFDTGIDAIDAANAASLIVSSTSDSMPDSNTADNQIIQTEAEGVVDMTTDSPFGDW